MGVLSPNDYDERDVRLSTFIGPTEGRFPQTTTAMATIKRIFTRIFKRRHQTAVPFKFEYRNTLSATAVCFDTIDETEPILMQFLIGARSIDACEHYFGEESHSLRHLKSEKYSSVVCSHADSAPGDSGHTRAQWIVHATEMHSNSSQLKADVLEASEKALKSAIGNPPQQPRITQCDYYRLMWWVDSHAATTLSDAIRTWPAFAGKCFLVSCVTHATGTTTDAVLVLYGTLYRHQSIIPQPLLHASKRNDLSSLEPTFDVTLGTIQIHPDLAGMYPLKELASKNLQGGLAWLGREAAINITGDKDGWVDFIRRKCEFCDRDSVPANAILTVDDQTLFYKMSSSASGQRRTDDNWYVRIRL